MIVLPFGTGDTFFEATIYCATFNGSAFVKKQIGNDVKPTVELPSLCPP